MVRALPVLACLIVLLLPGVAGARAHQVSLNRGEIAISYDGSAERDSPTGLYCPGTNPCTAFGDVGSSLGWEATAIADRFGNISESDTTLKASGRITVEPNVGLPAGASPSTAPGCDNVVQERKRYDDGTRMTRTRHSIGVQVELPFSLRWLEVSGDPGNCQMSPATWAGSVFSLGSAGPTSDAEVAKLQLTLRPKMGAPKSARRTTREFDYSFERDTRTGPYGVYKSKIVSSVTIVNGCERFNVANGRCVKYYD
jgi:hypothetical protein